MLILWASKDKPYESGRYGFLSSALSTLMLDKPWQTLAMVGALNIYIAAEQKTHLLTFLKSTDELTINFATMSSAA